MFYLHINIKLINLHKNDIDQFTHTDLSWSILMCFYVILIKVCRRCKSFEIVKRRTAKHVFSYYDLGPSLNPLKWVQHGVLQEWLKRSHFQNGQYQKVQFSNGSIFRRSNFQKVQFSKGPIFKKSNFQKVQFWKLNLLKTVSFAATSFFRHAGIRVYIDKTLSMTIMMMLL